MRPEAEKEPRVERGDVQVDADGSRWIVTGVRSQNGPHFTSLSRVREGSLAANILFPGHEVAGSGGGS